MLKLKKTTYLKILAIILGILPLIWLSYLIIYNQLGADPAKDVQHFTGKTTINFLLATLMLSPLAKLPYCRIVTSLRRTLGLTTFVWSTLHIFSYFAFELAFDAPLFFSELLSRTYLIIGAIAYFGLFLLAITSNQFSMKILKKRWKSLHNFVYPIAILAACHYYIALKVKEITPIIYIIIFISLWLFHHIFHYIKKHKKATK